MRRKGYAAHMKQKRNVHRELARKPKGESPLGRSRRGWGTVLKRNLKKQERRTWIGFICLGIRTGDRHL
jgi:hypothetical protein